MAEALENSYGEFADKSDFAECLLQTAKVIVEDNFGDYFTELCRVKEGSLLSCGRRWSGTPYSSRCWRKFHGSFLPQAERWIPIFLPRSIPPFPHKTSKASLSRPDIGTGVMPGEGRAH